MGNFVVKIKTWFWQTIWPFRIRAHLKEIVLLLWMFLLTSRFLLILAVHFVVVIVVITVILRVRISTSSTASTCAIPASLPKMGRRGNCWMGVCFPVPATLPPVLQIPSLPDSQTGAVGFPLSVIPALCATVTGPRSFGVVLHIADVPLQPVDAELIQTVIQQYHGFYFLISP